MQIKPKRSKPPLTVQQITVNVANQPNLEIAIIQALLAKLGLVSDVLINKFNAQSAYENIVTGFAVQLHSDGKWLAKQISTAKIQGNVDVTVGVDIVIVNAIASFLGQPVFNDAGEQLARGVTNAGDGTVKDSAEAMNDLNLGGGKVLTGAASSLTAPVGSNSFQQGISDLSDGSKQFGTGLGKLFVQNPADFLMMYLGANVSGLQTMTFLEAVGRALNAAEVAVLTAVFGSSVEYGAIRIKEGNAGLLNAGDDNGLTLTNNNRPLTVGNTIYMKNLLVGSSTWDSTLVHETTHVWQNQNGGTDYMTEALYAQILGEGYDYDISIRQGKTWFLLNPEQQAHLIEDAFANGFLQNGVPNGQWIDPRTKARRLDLEQYFINQNILGQLRSGQGAT